MLRLAPETNLRLDVNLMGTGAASLTLDQIEDSETQDTIERLKVSRWPVSTTVGLVRVWTRLGTGTLVLSFMLGSVAPALVLLVAMVIPLAWANARARQIALIGERAAADERRAAWELFDLGLTSAAARECRILGWSAPLVAQFQAKSRRADEGIMQAESRASWLRLAAWFVYIAAVGGVIVLVFPGDSLGASLSNGEIFLLAVALVMLPLQGREWAQCAVRTAEWIDAADDLLAFDGGYALRESSDRSACVRGVPPDIAVRLDGASLRYTGSDKDALRSVSLDIRCGEVLAIVGANGSGKSTFASLLLGLRKPTSGECSLSDQTIDCGQSVAFQDFFRFEFALRDSVGIGRGDEEYTDQEVVLALERADAAELLSLEGLTLDTVLGPERGGRDLSGGQWQRVAIARALVKEGASLYVFDEPTSAIDPVAEVGMLDMLRLSSERLAANAAAVVIITHRLALARKVDRIAVFDNGQLLELGTHEQLIEAGGLYCGMYESQKQSLLGGKATHGS